MYTPRKELTSNYKGFQQIVQMEDAGVILHCNAPAKDDVVLCSVPCIVLIIKMKIDLANAFPKLDTNRINCPRCKRMLQNAQELMYRAPGMKSNILGICDHCRLKMESHEPCTECEMAIKKFLQAYGMGKKDVREFIRIWLTSKKDESKIKECKDMSLYKICRSYSDGDIDGMKGRQFKTESKFHSELRIPSMDTQLEQQIRKEGSFKDIERDSDEYLSDSAYYKKDTAKMDAKLYDQKSQPKDEKTHMFLNLIFFPKKETQNQLKQELEKFKERELATHKEIESPKQIGDKQDTANAEKDGTKVDSKYKSLDKKSHTISEGKSPKEYDEIIKLEKNLDEKRLKDAADKKDLEEINRLMDLPDQKLKEKTVAEKEDTKRDSKPKPDIKKDTMKETDLKKEATIAALKIPGRLPKDRNKEYDDKRLKDAADKRDLDKINQPKDFPDQKLKAKTVAEKDDIKLKKEAKSYIPKDTMKETQPKKEATTAAGKSPGRLAKGKNKEYDDVMKLKQKNIDEKRLKDAADKRVLEAMNQPKDLPDKKLKAKTVAEKEDTKKDSKPKSDLKKDTMKETEPKKEATTAAGKSPGQIPKDKNKEYDDKMKQKQKNIDEKRLKDAADKRVLAAMNQPKDLPDRKLKAKTVAEKEDTKRDSKPKSDIKEDTMKETEPKKEATTAAEKSPGQLSKDENKEYDDIMKLKQKNIDEKRPKDAADKRDLEQIIQPKNLPDQKLKAKTVAEKEDTKRDSKPKSDIKKDTMKETDTEKNAEKELEKEILNKTENLIVLKAKLEREHLEAERKKKELAAEHAKIQALALKLIQEMMAKRAEELRVPPPSEEYDISSKEYSVINLNHTCQANENNIIIGENIASHRPPIISRQETKKNIPLIFKNNLILSPIHSEKEKIMEAVGEENVKEAMSRTPKTPDQVEPEDKTKGVMHYALSDRTFIEKGWTMLPTEKVVRKMNVYRMRPAHPEFDWFERNKSKHLMTYDSGERLAEFNENGRGRWYYRNGRIALDYYDAAETNVQQRFVVYSSGEPDERGRTHPITILATFDYLGNGIVFDHAGKIRLKYNQTEGVVLDRGIGPVTHWKWHTLNDPPVLQQVMMDTQIAHKDPTILQLGDDKKLKASISDDNEDMVAIEFDNFVKEKQQKLTQNFKPFQIKMKALKINQHFSLRVLDQATVYLIFRDGSANLKLNIGMVLDHREIVDTDTAEVGEVANSLERFPARTDSLAGLQHSIACAQRYERTLTERERRTRPTLPCASVDKLVAHVSRPMRRPLRTVPTVASGSASSSSSKCCRKKPSTNLYYDTRM